MTNGVGLGAAFNQDGADINDQHAKKEKQAESFQSKKNIYDKIQHAKLGNLVAYTKGIGKIVKKDGAYVTVFNEDANSYDQVHVGETYVPGDTISMGVMNKLWDQMQQEVRMGLLSKANIQEPLHFVYRSWNELPQSLRDVIKQSPSISSYGWGVPKDQVPKGAIQDKNPYGKPKETESKPAEVKPESKPKRSTKKPQIRTALSHYLDRKTTVKKSDVEHGAKPRGDIVSEPDEMNSAQGQATIARVRHDDGRSVPNGMNAQTKPMDRSSTIANARFKKSDVEHGAYGGVVTDTPFDADEEYEEDHREGKRAQIKYDENKKPENHKEDADEVMVGYHEKAIRNKYNTRYGPRQVTAEEAEDFFLDKSRARTIRGRERVHTQSRAGQLKPQTFKKPITDSEDPGEEGGKARGSSTRTTNTTSHGTTGIPSKTGKDDPPKSGFKTSFRGHRNVSQRTGPDLKGYHND